MTTAHGTVDQLDDLAATITSGLTDVRHNIDAVGPTVAATLAATTLPGPVADALVWCAEQLVSLVNGLISTIEDALRGIAAPVAFYVHANDWQAIRSTASTVTGRLKPEAMPATTLWSGSAATAYRSVIRPQGDAANRLATIADKTSTALYFSAAAGCAFYVALGAIVVKLIAATAAAIVAFGSEVFSWAGALIILEEAGITGGLITAAVAALVAALTAQANQLITLRGEAGDNSAFPGGTWPDPVAGTYADATVTDGDADWSLQR